MSTVMADLGVNLVLEPSAGAAVVAAAAALLLLETVRLAAQFRPGPKTAPRKLPEGIVGQAGFIVALALLVWFWRSTGSVIAVAACAAAWAARSYRRTTSPLPSSLKKLLIALRVAAILLVGLWALDPQLEYQAEQETRRLVLIGVDGSSSMQRRDVVVAAAGPADTRSPAEAPPAHRPISRQDALQQAFARNSAALGRLAEQADVRVFQFAASPRPAADVTAADPIVTLGPADGAATAIGDSAQAALDEQLRGGADVAAVVLISDGCNNTAETLSPEAFASRAAVAGIAVHAVGVGSDQPVAGQPVLSVKELDAPDQVQVFDRLPIRAVVEADGLAGRTVLVRYRFGEDPNSAAAAAEPNASQEFVIDADQQNLTVQFTHIPTRPGFRRLTVEAKCESDEPPGLGGRRQAAKLVQVVDHELRILYLEGRFRYEVKFIAQGLLSGGRFSVDRRILLQPLRADAPPPLGEDLDDWLGYHAVILGDLSAASLSPRQHQILADLVGKYGRGLCMIGGSQSFGRGGWADTPLAGVLPVDLAASKGQIDANVQVTPTRDGLASELMAIGDPNLPAADAWSRLGPLPGANDLRGVKPGATVLAADTAGHPLIVEQNYGAGRSLAIAFDTTWMWATRREGGADLQRRFWRQVALYLCAPKGNVWILADKPSYDAARLAEGREAVEVTAGVEDPAGRPLADAQVKATLTSPGGIATPLSLPADQGRRLTRLAAGQVTQSGTYILRIETQVAGKPLSAEYRFEVVQQDLEALDSAANLKLMRLIAEQGGGAYVPLAGMGDLLRRLVPACSPRTLTRLQHVDLSGAARWPAIVLLLILLSLEWIIRKRKGLV